jgi:hypothetical protein
MKRPIPVFFVLLSCAGLAAAAAQSQAPAQDAVASRAQASAAAPERQQSPSMKALNDAGAIKDLDEKIAAYR